MCFSFWYKPWPVLLHYPPYPGASYGPYVTKTSLNCLAFTLRGPSKPKRHRITNTNATKNTPKNTNHLVDRAPFGMAWSNKPTLCVKHPWLPAGYPSCCLQQQEQMWTVQKKIFGPNVVCTQQQGLAGTFVLRLVLKKSTKPVSHSVLTTDTLPQPWNKTQALA